MASDLSRASYGTASRMQLRCCNCNGAYHSASAYNYTSNYKQVRAVGRSRVAQSVLSMAHIYWLAPDCTLDAV
eukprot:4484200-Pleurochrysis_carterae.AAC.2